VHFYTQRLSVIDNPDDDDKKNDNIKHSEIHSKQHHSRRKTPPVKMFTGITHTHAQRPIE